MSVYRQQATVMNDRDSLVKALQKAPSRNKHRFEPQCHDQAVALEGFEGKRREEKAEIVLPRKQVGGAANDIGFARDEKGNFRAIISEYDSHFYNEKWLSEVKVEYAKELGTKISRSAGFTPIATRTMPDGKIRLQFAKH